MLCRLEGKTHPRHWLEFYLSHTPREWARQKAMAIVEPFGEDRADVRFALGIRELIAAVRPEVQSSTLSEVYKLLTNYTGDDVDDEQMEVNPEALAKIRNPQ